MDQNKFEKLISEHYEYKRDTDGTRNCRKKEVINSTFPLVVTKKKEPTPCEDCGKPLASGTEKKFNLRNKEWTERCANCRRLRDKVSGEMRYLHEITRLPVGRPRLESDAISTDDLPKLLPQLQELQSTTTETVTISDQNDGFVEQVIERECHEFLIREYSRIPVESQPDSDDAQDSDNEAHIN